MFTDIVFPNKNEEEFINIAEKLNVQKFYLIYKFDKQLKKYEKLLKKLQKDTKIKLHLGFYSEKPKHYPKQKHPLFIRSTSKDREVLERNKNVILFGLENHKKNDFIHHRASGLNQVLCNIAKKNNNSIAFSFNDILHGKETTPAILGRMTQNIKFCKKYKVNTIIASFAKSPYEMRSPKDLISLFLTLGMDQNIVKKSIQFE